ncbi:MAG: hypothetical protein EHM13_08000, partial [Acidobacteria bacterium]
MAGPLAELLSGRVSPARQALGPPVLPRNEFTPTRRPSLEDREPYVSETLADMMAKGINAFSHKPYQEALADSKTLVGLLPGVNAGADTNTGLGEIEQGNYASGALDLASSFADAIPGGHAAAAAAKPAILIGLPNLFRKAALEDAARGVDPDSIWKQWGWEQQRPAGWNGINYRDEQWVREIPDTNAKLRTDVATTADGVGKMPQRRMELGPAESDPNQPLLPFRDRDIEPTEPLIRATKPGDYDMKPDNLMSLFRTPKGRVDTFLDHPALFNEPGLEEIARTPMTMPSGGLSPNVAGQFSIPTAGNPIGGVTVKMPGHDPLGTTIHELGHKAQNMGDMPGGFSPSSPGATSKGLETRNQVYRTLRNHEAAINQRTSDYWKAEEAWFRTHPEDQLGPEHLKLSNFNKQWAIDNPELQADISRRWQLPENMREIGKINDWNTEFLGYMTEGGETSARNMTKRAKMSLL